MCKRLIGKQGADYLTKSDYVTAMGFTLSDHVTVGYKKSDYVTTVGFRLSHYIRMGVHTT